MNSNPDIITLSGLSSVTETINKIEKALTDHGITIYARIDQQAEAVKAGLTLRPLELLIFGNPKGGVPLMMENPLSGLDLPLKVLAWEDTDHKVLPSYNAFSYLKKRFDLPENQIKSLSAMETLIKNALL
jgi:uncharacterized protein (DUF302 family)